MEQSMKSEIASPYAVAASLKTSRSATAAILNLWKNEVLIRH
jgi:hypothetical protein